MTTNNTSQNLIDTTTFRSPLNRTSSRKGSPIDMLVLHSTETKSLEETAACFMTEAERNVSVHYVVDRDGKIYQFVPEDLAAHHAGKSHWRLVDGSEVSNINSRSIGIEFQRGPGETFTPEQIQSGLLLSNSIVKRHNIPPEHVVAHSDIAPDRKSDPGNDFPWELWAQNGLAVNGRRRGNDGRNFNSSDAMIAAAQKGCFDLKNLENHLYTRREQSQTLAMNSNTTVTDEVTQTKESESPFLGVFGVALAALSGSENSSVAGTLLASLFSTSSQNGTNSLLASNSQDNLTNDAFSGTTSPINTISTILFGKSIV